LRRPGRGRPGHWGAVAAAGAVAALLPIVGSWAAAEREPDPVPAAASPPAQERDPRPSARPPSRRAGQDRVAIGAYIRGATERPRLIKRFARKTGLRPAILLYFRRMRTSRAFDAKTLRRVHGAGAVPLITWEPWRQPLRDIARGRHDGYLRSEARAARRWGRLILLRFAHEMNGDWYPWGAHANSPRAYVRAFRRVVTVFRREGATNVRFVWGPNEDTGGVRLIRRLYPGDRWVDWIGFSGFSWGGPWPWRQPIEVYRRMYRTLTGLADKPVMIAETGAGEVGGDKARWIKRAFDRDLPRLPRVRAVVWVNERAEWADFHVDSSRASLRAFKAAVADPRYAGTPADIKRGGL
jgi:hypothetical protein